MEKVTYCPVCHGSHSGGFCPIWCIACGCALESLYCYQKSKGPFCLGCAKEHGRTGGDKVVYAGEQEYSAKMKDTRPR